MVPCAALMNAEDSALLRHELAYVLGQIGDAAVVPNLVQVLRDTADDVMVRHEVRGAAAQSHVQACA